MGRVRKSFICVTSWLSSISNHRTQISRLPGTDLEASLLSFEKLDRASPDLWPEQLPGVAEFAASFKSPITSSPPKWMAEIERDDIDMLKELGSLTTANLMEKVRGLQNLAYQLGLDEFASVRTDSVQLHRGQPTRLPRPWDSPGKNTGVCCHFRLQWMKVKSENEVAQSCPILATPWTAAHSIIMTWTVFMI
ncbi:protein lin-52 homolog isoform X1 [Bos mutus]|uniref:protein lin-52 homolog isoform X1 n=1 Tax=Bos mutus TaxID=72004 RepID=UPI0038B56D78